MRSIAYRRILAGLVVLTTGSLPVVPLACLSGSEQEALAGAAFATVATPVQAAIQGAAPVIATGNDLADALLNGGIAQALGLVNDAATAWVGRQIDQAVPDDPFPFP